MSKGWINGGFFVANKKIFKFIKNDTTILEKEPLERLAKKKSLIAFKHYGFWRCMDTKRDKDFLEKLSKSKNIEWQKKRINTYSWWNRFYWFSFNKFFKKKRI